MSDLVDAWNIHARIQRYILDAVAPEALTVKGLKGRTVGEQFAHIHDVRRMWVQSAAPDLLDGVLKLGKEAAGDKGLLDESLVASAAAVVVVIERGIDSGKIKGFKPHPAAFVGYLISHESYHQGDIGVRLAESGHPLPKKVAFGVWEWGVR